MKLIFFFFNHNSFFQKKKKEQHLVAIQTTRSQLQDALALLFFSSKTATIFSLRKNNIEAETNKTPTTVADLTRKSRFRYIKIWICSISLRKHILKFFNKCLEITLTREYSTIFFNTEKYLWMKLFIPQYHSILR